MTHPSNEFSYKTTRDGQVFLYHRQRQIKTLKAREAARFLAKIEQLSEQQAGLLMAKITGNFKRGNERR